MSLYTTILFVLLVPGVIFTIPIKGSKLATALLHGVVFAVLFHFTHKAVWNTFYGTRHMEHFATKQAPAPAPKLAQKPPQKPPQKPLPPPPTLAKSMVLKQAAAKQVTGLVTAKSVAANSAPVCKETCSNKLTGGVCCGKNKLGQPKKCTMQGNKQYKCA